MTSLAAAALVLFASAAAPQAPSACASRSGGGVADGPAITFERIATSTVAIAEVTVVRVGRRFLVFLTPADPRLPVPPERPDLPRYGLAAGGRSMLCIDAGKVWVNRNGEFLKDRFDGVGLEKPVADIVAYLKPGKIPAGAP